VKMGIDVLSQFLTTTALPLGDAVLLFVFLLAAGVTGITFMGFAIWAAYHAIRVAVLVLARLALMPRSGRTQCAWPPAPRANPQGLACPDPVCRTINANHAHFCRQCGRMIRNAAHLAA
jgi:hypothetical protein